jgi:hypothetical protein
LTAGEEGSQKTIGHLSGIEQYRFGRIRGFMTFWGICFAESFSAPCWAEEKRRRHKMDEAGGVLQQIKVILLYNYTL